MSQFKNDLHFSSSILIQNHNNNDFNNVQHINQNAQKFIVSIKKIKDFDMSKKKIISI